jgi:hypothetical protein
MRKAVIINTAALLSAAVSALAGNPNTDYITPAFAFSPDGRYGVMIPVWHDQGAQERDDRMNKVVELRTNHVVAVIPAEPGYNRALNFHKAAPPSWSSDSSLLLWKVEGKWNPDALVLLKIEQNRAKWELDLLKTAQQAVLSRTRKASPQQYEVCKQANRGNGAAFPDGFTVNVTTDGQNTKTVSLPLRVHADLSANPKQIENLPDLDSHLDAVVTADGRFVVKDFHVSSPVSEQDLVKKLVGEWEGRVHIRAYYADGSFTLDPAQDEKPLGTWKVRGDQLMMQLPDEPTPMIERLVKITDTEMVTTNEGTRYTYKRVARQ